MSLNTGNGSAVLSPTDVQELVVKPLLASAVSALVSTIVTTASHSTRFPIVNSDATAAWTAEGAEIAVSDPDLDELVVTPPALKGLVVCSNELVNDSDPSALDIVGDGLVRDLRVKLDASYFGGAGVGVAPDGIESLADVQETSEAFDGSLDVVAEAISLAETSAGVLLEELSLVAHPADVLRLNVAKTDNTTSNVALLAPDASSPTRRSALGVPLYASPAVTEGIAWLVPRTRVFLVVRADVDVQFDSSWAFSSDRTAVRAVLRISPAFPNPEAIVKVIIDGGS